MTKLPMTTAGHAALEDELNRRTGIERPRLIQRIQEAIADGHCTGERRSFSPRPQLDRSASTIRHDCMEPQSANPASKTGVGLVQQISTMALLLHCGGVPPPVLFGGYLFNLTSRPRLGNVQLAPKELA